MDESPGKWRWLVLVGSFLNMMMNVSMNYHTGVMNIAVLDTYEADATLVAWLMSVYSSMFALTAPLASALINLTSCKVCVVCAGIVTFIGFVASSFVNQVEWLFLTLTLCGIGQALSQVGGTLVLAFHFPATTAIVNGISLAGSGLGSFIHPPVMQVLIDSYGLKWTFSILGAYSLHSCVAGLIFRPTERERRRRSQHNEDRRISQILFGDSFKHMDILRIPAFAAVMLSVFTFSVAFQNVIIFLPEFTVQNLGLSPQEASVVAAVVGIGSVISRIFSGFAVAETRIGATLLYSGMNAVAFLTCMTANLLFQWHAGIYIVTFCMGVYGSACQSLFNPLTLDLLDLERTAAGYGMVLLAYGGGSLIGPPIGALLVKNMGDSIFFYFIGLMFFLTSFIAASQTFCLKQGSRPLDVDASLRFDAESENDKQIVGSPLLNNENQLESNKLDSTSVLLSGNDSIPSVKHGTNEK